ncbi:MAG: hypothetical protein J5658_14950 [Prevotella sp.]|nr:hypothetical protein [Prevotella sp.]
MSEQAYPSGLTDLESEVRSITQQPRLKEQKKPQKEQRPKEASAIKTVWQRFTVICAVEIVVKIKAIARIEGFSIREVIEKFLRDGIARYEQKHGAVTNRKKSIDEVL